ncbi:neutral/alkaline non-lysosomal ceramidase N-terminal domain-containing protein [Sporosalibacterium faouarense]|uniref:neutral/alkaline non-lysosomal ceramidase N-terminal domain-containing protein n=1 Tax=Sporosalibacterium faouarense TaxID=516123 RepID=UPI00141C8E5B|nr:neutral/alkaline non-lysosomal ceramidase N-terminal domain-containing protein [Sporosalibacterium faouarense]MTI47124.1 hypothetical protein [Bacillota bacterium]
MKIGRGKQDITPLYPIVMGGYGDRSGKSQDVLDRIFARTIVLEDDEEQKIVIIALDIIGLTRVQIQYIKKNIFKLTGILKENIVISVTHTHSGPLTYDYPTMGKADEEYVEWLYKVIPTTVVKALKDLKECKIDWYQGNFSDVGNSRRSRNKKVEPILTILGFTDLRDNLLATLFNYNCHPTVLSAANLEISADYPGASIDLLEKVYGEDALFVFTNGACGDISTRFTRRSQDYREVKRLGSLLAAEVIKVLNKMEFTQEVPNVFIKGRDFELQPRELPSLEELETQEKVYQERLIKLENEGADGGDIRIAHTALQGVRVQKLLKEYASRLELNGIMKGIKIGNGVIITQPAELFSSLGNTIINASPYEITMVIGYAEGSIGYLPDKKSYNEGGYEALSCRFKVGEGERLADMAISLLKEME